MAEIIASFATENNAPADRIANMAKQRVDALLVERGLAESRTQAQRLVMAGQVRANGQVVPKASSLLADETSLEVIKGPRYVSRGGEKLEAALTQFEIDPTGQICADVGSSTGGFTDCLLQHGASKVYAIDVGKGQLDWKLRQDERVVVMEQTNARTLNKLPEPVSLATVDASFISLKTLLPVVLTWLAENGQLIALIKPQFEAGKQEAARGEGVIRDPEIHRRILSEVLGFAEQNGFGLFGLIRSPLVGPKGNIEFLLWAGVSEASVFSVDQLIAGALPQE
jgi:23S rRNA (cytidine1920-2'-O)/16S rRNA (cytidine1409-2'-O)-methyltransferase